jgi:hypothetical protein
MGKLKKKMNLGILGVSPWGFKCGTPIIFGPECLEFQYRDDYMCVKPIKRTLVSIKCFGYCNKSNGGYGS